ncbi:hypothetical protein V2G26_019745 [Clonostachys chloroleuca]
MGRRRAESNSYPASAQSRPYSKRRKHHDEEPGDGILTPEIDETTLRRSAYTIAWICALHIELAAAQAMLDTEHDELPGLADDDNTYILGNVGKHNVVIACLPASQYGTNNAASIITDMKRTFPAIRVGLMVGIGGAAPAMADIRLGDVVVGTRVMQYDLGKILSDDEFEYTAIPKIPQRLLGTVVSTLRSKHELRPSSIPAILDDKLEDNKRYSRPESPDWLFHASYCHEDPRAFCETCDQTKLVLRPARSSTDPEIHYGAIASGNQVMRDAIKRDKIARDLNVICFEMEAAGLMDSLPCLPIRGICDYSDSHKNKKWQRYAAATAAAYAKELLDVMPSAGSEKTTAIRTPKPNENSLLEGLLSSKDDEMSPLQRRRRLIKALEFEQIHLRKAAIMETHSDTCRWFLEHEAYQSWSDPSQVSEHHGFLWINGKPGAGKSTLMKFLYTESRKLCQKNVSATSSFFFNARGEKLEKSIAGMYRSLLVQLFNSFEDTHEVLDEMDLEPDHLIDWPLGTLKDLLRNAIFRLNERQLTCFIDALDECDEQQIVEMVHYFETLAEHCAGAAIPLKICFSSRHYPYIHIEKGIKLTLEDQEGHSEDLAAYVEGRLRVKGDALEELQLQILNKAAGVFLWVVLVVDILNKEERRGRLAMKRRLTELPSRLTDLFRDMVARDQEYMEDLLLSILWILYAKRPLTPAEYYHALWIGLQEKCDADPELPGVDDLDSIKRYVVSSSKGLAETTKVEPQRVQFIHESVRDFLLKDKGIAEIWPELGHDWETSAHERLKDCCYRYMSDPRSYGLYSTGVFFRYAREYVLAHANGAAKSVPQQRFLSRFPLLTYCRGYRYRPDTDLLYILADQGLSNLIAQRLEDFPRIETRGNFYRFPLFAAIKNHHPDAVVALLASGMDLSEATDISKNLTYGLDYSQNFTMLTWAIDAGYISIISLCLSKGSFANEEDPSGDSPLGMAVRRNNLEMVQLLLDNGAKPQNCGPQVLIDAVQSQNIDIVRALLDHGCDPNKSDGHYRPLKVAHNRQNDELVQLLVAYGANPWFT